MHTGSRYIEFNVPLDTHNRSFRKWVFAGNWLHRYWQPKTRKQNIIYTRNTKEEQKKTCPS